MNTWARLKGWRGNVARRKRSKQHTQFQSDIQNGEQNLKCAGEDRKVLLRDSLNILHCSVLCTIYWHLQWHNEWTIQNIKIIKTQIEKITYNYKNMGENLLKTKAVIRFNKLCNKTMMTAKHVHMKITPARVFSWVLINNIKICFELELCCSGLRWVTDGCQQSNETSSFVWFLDIYT